RHLRHPRQSGSGSSQLAPKKSFYSNAYLADIWPNNLEIVAAGHEIAVLDVVRRRQEASGVDHGAGAEQDAVAVDEEDAAVRAQVTQDLRGPEPSDHAIERDRPAVGLVEAHALVHADVERVPVDDRVLARLVDDHRGAALPRDGRRAADDGA